MHYTYYYTERKTVLSPPPHPGTAGVDARRVYTHTPCGPVCIINRNDYYPFSTGGGEGEAAGPARSMVRTCFRRRSDSGRGFARQGVGRHSTVHHHLQQAQGSPTESSKYSNYRREYTAHTTHKRTHARTPARLMITSV